MKKVFIFNFSALFLCLVFFYGCNSKGKTFEVKGEITSGAGDTLYLEHRGLGGVEILDSVKIKKDGTFLFKSPAPENPEFYQLRLNDQVVMFAIDSIETLRVSANADNLMQTFATVTSIVNDQVKQIDAKASYTRKEFADFAQKHKSGKIDDMTYLETIDSVLTNYKDFATNLILGNPSGAAAYYALFQKINDYLIFDPMNRKDYAMFGAVATSWDRYYPGTQRSKHLHDFTMNALKSRKQSEQQAQILENATVETTSTLFEIELPDIMGKQVSLSSLKGKVVLLDFTVYNSDFSVKHNINLNSLYSQLASKGFEIYQVSLDSDDHFWKNAAVNLPWVAVRDANSIQSLLLAKYNVRDLPTSFILDREGNLVSRIENYANLLSVINKVL
mgnify:CR=1 FL=1